MSTRNKYAQPPYVEVFNILDASQLYQILGILKETCCKSQTVEGAMIDLDCLMNRPSSLRKVDSYHMKPLSEAINRVAALSSKNPITENP